MGVLSNSLMRYSYAINVSIMRMNPFQQLWQPNSVAVLISSLTVQRSSAASANASAPNPLPRLHFLHFQIRRLLADQFTQPGHAIVARVKR